MSGANSHRVDAADLAAMIEEARGIATAAADDHGLPFEKANLELVAGVKALDPAAYERIREILKSSGVRVPELDRLIASALGEGLGEADSRLPGRRLEWPEEDVWADPVDGADLLHEVAATLRRFVVMQAHAAETAALWSLAAHSFDSFDIFPRLGITSPTKECGKSTLMKMLRALVPRPLPASNTTAAAIFRAVELAQPTLLVDEADTFLPENQELRGILNSGHARDGAFVLRVVGEEHEPRMFSTWAPMAIAMIGELPATLASRSLRIRMQRRLAGESASARVTIRPSPGFAARPRAGPPTAPPTSPRGTAMPPRS